MSFSERYVLLRVHFSQKNVARAHQSKEANEYLSDALCL